MGAMSYPCEHPIGTGIVRQNISNKLYSVSGKVCVRKDVDQVIEQCTNHFDEFEEGDPLYNTTVCRSLRAYFTFRAKLLVPKTNSENTTG